MPITFTNSTPAWQQFVITFANLTGVTDQEKVHEALLQLGGGDDSIESIECVVKPELTSNEALIEKIKELNPGINVKKLGLVVEKVRAYNATPVAEPKPAEGPNAEIPEGKEPSKADVNSFASTVGMDPTMLMMFMSGNMADMDLSSMMPISTVVGGYNPKVRNMFLMVMGQVERKYGVPIVVIDEDGSVNRALTVEYIEGLEEGRDPCENNIYFGSDGQPHEVIRVGVDTKSIYDADPLAPTKALQKNGMGIGRVLWKGVSLEVRQVAYYAANLTGEISTGNDGHMSWLRDHMKSTAKRLVFHGQAPKAIAMFNEAARTGSLPTLRVMLSSSPRTPETMPRRRTATPRNLSAPLNPDLPNSGYDYPPRDGTHSGWGQTRGGTRSGQ